MKLTALAATLLVHSLALATPSSEISIIATGNNENANSISKCRDEEQCSRLLKIIAKTNS